MFSKETIWLTNFENGGECVGFTTNLYSDSVFSPLYYKTLNIILKKRENKQRDILQLA